MAKHYKSRAEALTIRTVACELAADLIAAREETDPAQLMALCVFFESYIGHGSRWTEKHMKLMAPSKAPILKLVPKGAA